MHDSLPVTTTQVYVWEGLLHTCHPGAAVKPPPFVSFSNLPGEIKGSDGPVSAHSPGITQTISPALRDNGP